MALGSLSGLRADLMKVTGSMMLNQVLECLTLKGEMNTQENFLTIRGRGMDLINGQITAALKVGGMKTSNMVLECTLVQIKLVQSSDCGKWAKESSGLTILKLTKSEKASLTTQHSFPLFICNHQNQKN